MAEDRAALDIVRLVAEHHPVVYRYAYRLTGSTADAEDLTQQVFLQAQEKLGQLRQVESARSWLLAIVRNQFLRECDKRKPVPAGDLRLDVQSIPDDIAEEAIDREALQAALNELPPHYRVVVTMFYFEDCSYREIAERLGVPIGTVMSRLARAKEHLRARLLSANADERATCRTDAASPRG
jgi:RNA polymerase sigma-70 factor (ECF subfamily)